MLSNLARALAQGCTGAVAWGSSAGRSHVPSHKGNTSLGVTGSIKANKDRLHGGEHAPAYLGTTSLICPPNLALLRHREHARRALRSQGADTRRYCTFVTVAHCPELAPDATAPANLCRDRWVPGSNTTPQHPKKIGRFDDDLTATRHIGRTAITINVRHASMEVARAAIPLAARRTPWPCFPLQSNGTGVTGSAMERDCYGLWWARGADRTSATAPAHRG